MHCPILCFSKKHMFNLSLSVQNKIRKVEKNSSTANSVGCIKIRYATSDNFWTLKGKLWAFETKYCNLFKVPPPYGPIMLVLWFNSVNIGSGQCLLGQELEPQEISTTRGPSIGYVSSAVASQTGYGSERCPVIITAQEGQRINVTLLDFRLKNESRVSTLSTNPFESSRNSHIQQAFSIYYAINISINLFSTENSDILNFLLHKMHPYEPGV